jgi:GT2 family glycosyltransferase
LNKKNPNHLTPHCVISVVIPNWNGARYLEACLPALHRQSFTDAEIIVVDNGSEDESVNLIRRDYPSVRLIELPENVGFAAACNHGIRDARGRFIVLLNNDTEADPGWLEALHDAAVRDKTIGMVASKILLSLETCEIDSVGMLVYADGIGRQRGRGRIDDGRFDKVEEILYPSACAALYKKEMFDDIGLFDEDFFLYCEDTDLGLRAQRAGWKAVFAPKAVVLHKYSMTGGGYSLFKAMHVERNRMWVGIKNFPISWIVRMPFHTLRRYFFQACSMVSSRGSTARLKESHSFIAIVWTGARAYMSAFAKMPSMLRKRKEIRRTGTDAELAAIMRKHLISARELILHD